MSHSNRSASIIRFMAMGSLAAAYETVSTIYQFQGLEHTCGKGLELENVQVK